MVEIKSEADLQKILSTPGALDEHIGDVVKESFTGIVKDAVSEVINREEVQAAIAAKRLPMGEETAGAAAPNGVKGGFTIDRETVRQLKLGITRIAGKGDFPRFGDFLRTVRMAPGDTRLKAALAEGSGELGGFTVPEEYEMTLRYLALEDAIIRPRAFRIPMGSYQVRLPVIRDTTHASNVFGGVTANWEAEAATLPESEPTFAQVQLTARKLTGYTVASNELLADSAIGLEALLMRIFPEAITWFEENAFINGNGAGAPLGILNAPALINVTRTAASAIVYEDIVNMYSRMLPRSRANGIWIAHTDTLPQLLTMSLNVGTGGSAVWVVPGGAQDGPPVTIFGRPVYFSEHCASMGTNGDIFFADFSYYLLGDRSALSMAASPHVKFTTDQTVWRFIERLDARPWIDSALTPQHGTNTLSPFVALAT